LKAFTIGALVAVALALVAATALGTDTGTGVASQTQTVHVKQSSLNDHQGVCLNAGGTIEGWKFIITLQAPRGGSVAAPASITVHWDTTGNGIADTSAVVPLEKQVGNAAHYFTAANAGATVVDATAEISKNWTGNFVLSSVDCVFPKANVKLEKTFEVGPFTPFGVACFTLTPNTGASSTTQCATGDSHFQWNDLLVGDYTIEETTVPAGYKKMADIQFKVRVDCTGVTGTCLEAGDPPPTYTFERSNKLEKGRLQVLKQLGTDTGPVAWPADAPSVTFHVCQNDPKTSAVADDTCDAGRLKDTIVVTQANNPGVSKLLRESYYTVCEVVPAGYEVSPSRCQAVQVLAGSSASANQVTFVNTPTDFEGCTPGFWRQPHHFGAWPTGYHPDDKFNDVFGPGLPGELTLSEAVALGGGGINALARHSVAALLNAAHPDVNYKFSEQQVKDMWAAAIASGDPDFIEETKDLLDVANNTGCPL
jgi:hypothetical protein